MKGKIVFRKGELDIAIVALDDQGQAQLVIDALAPGSHDFTAIYQGDADHWGSTSNVVTQVITTKSPSNSVAPTVPASPQAYVSQTGTRGTWSGVEPITYTYQWQADSVDIVDATALTYMPTATEVGKSLRLKVTATNAHGSLVAFSEQSNAVAAEDPDMASWVATVVANGGTVSNARRSLVAALVGGLKTDGIWAKLDRLWLFAAENSASGRTDLVAKSLATAVNAPTFTTDRGFKGNGTSAYINTGYNPATGAAHYSVNSACAGIWEVSAIAPGGRLVFSSRVASAYSVDVTMNYNLDGKCYWRINSTSAAQMSPTYPGAGGMYIGNRSGASAAQLYFNGSSIATSAVASGIGAVPNGNVYVLASNDNGTAGWFALADEQIAACLFGGSLNATEHTALYGRLRTYMTAVGVP